VELTIDDQLGLLFDDEDFREVQARMARFNLFEAMGTVHAELRHSNFLAYLLSPNRPHGLGTRPLQQILRRTLELIAPAERPFSTLELMVSDLDSAVVHRERDGIDLLIEIEVLNLVIVVENKIRAKAGDGQLKRYRDLVEARYPTCRKLLLFLTPEGSLPDEEAYWPLSYTTLAATLEALGSDLPPADPTALIIRHYVDMLRKNIVEDAHLRSLAAKLYERHAEALDFIFESRPRPAGLVDIIGQRVGACEGLTIDSQGVSTLRFAPDRWDEQLSYQIDRKEWSRTGRGLLFEVKSFTQRPGRLNISLIIGPGDSVYRQSLYDAARARPALFTGLVKPMYPKFCTIFSRDLLTAERAETMSAEAQATNLGLAWSDFQAMTLMQLIDAVLEMDAEITSPPSGP
jgi:hypothetical protein